MQLKNVLYNQFETYSANFITIRQFLETINNGQEALKNNFKKLYNNLFNQNYRKKEQPWSQLMGSERVNVPNMEAQ